MNAHPEELFDAVVAELRSEPGVTLGTGFGQSPGLRVGEKIFAMLVGGEFVAKLPRERCEELVGDNAAVPLRIGKREMREWVQLTLHDERRWIELAREALAFVGGSSRS